MIYLFHFTYATSNESDLSFYAAHHCMSKKKMSYRPIGYTQLNVLIIICIFMCTSGAWEYLHVLIFLLLCKLIDLRFCLWKKILVYIVFTFEIKWLVSFKVSRPTVSFPLSAHPVHTCEGAFSVVKTFLQLYVCSVRQFESRVNA